MGRAWRWTPIHFAADANCAPRLRTLLRAAELPREILTTTLLEIARQSNAPCAPGAESAVALLERAGGAWSRKAHSLMCADARAVVPTLLLVGERVRVPRLVWEWHVLSYLGRRGFGAGATRCGAGADEDEAASLASAALAEREAAERALMPTPDVNLAHLVAALARMQPFHAQLVNEVEEADAAMGEQD